MHPIHRTLGAAACLITAGLFAQEEAIDPDRAANLVILDETGIRNLRIESEQVEERDFESTVFAVGRIEEIPSRRSVLSSRIPGRAVRVEVIVGDRVEEGQTLVAVESRQPGDPPPTVELKALQSGLVVDSHVHPGQPVEPEQELLDISDRSEMWAVAQIPEQEAAEVQIGTPARIFVPAAGGTAVEATLLRFGVNADREAGTVEGIFQIANPGERLQPGMRAEFSVITGKKAGVLAVPLEAVQGDPAHRVVYVKDFELPNAFVRSPVALGEQNDSHVEVLSGVFPGDEVVTRGSYSLGFAGGATAVSLKEALDAAHGHEHNEDGSEMTPEEQAARDRETGGAEAEEGHGHGDGAPRWLVYYAAGATLAALFFAQRVWDQMRRKV
jgi:multidrug efflux pump subunit AcrA (membrane-fusion protein)